MTGRRPDGGQAAVEVALVMPVIALLLLGLIQVALVVRDQVLVVHAAREAARAAAVDPSPGAARRAALAATSLSPARLEVTGPDAAGAGAPGPAAPRPPGGAGSPGRLVTAVVRYRSATDLPLIGPLLPDVGVRGRATMRREY